MLNVQAITIGSAVPWRDFAVTVHSVFREAVNLRLRKRTHLFTLLTLDCPDLPQGIRLGAPPGFSFEDQLVLGDEMVCKDSILEDVFHRLTIDLHPAKRWHCRLPGLEVEEISPPVQAAWKSVWQVLRERQKHLGTELRVDELFQTNVTGHRRMTERMGALIGELVEAVRQLDLSVESIIAGLVGLGHGLTPSGDDFLVGYLAGLHCTAVSRNDRQSYLTELSKIVVRLSRQTNDISRTYLWHASHGQVSSYLVALAHAIAQGENSDRLLPAAENALHMGHTSGMDTVSGLLLGLATWGSGFYLARSAMPVLPLSRPVCCDQPGELLPPGSPVLGV